MPKNINSSFRIHEILEQALKENDSDTCADVWAHVFAIDEENLTKKQFRVSECLNTLHKEIESALAQMDDTDFSSGLYSPAFHSAERAIVINNLDASWGTFKRHISDDVLIALRFCSEILPDEESLIDAKDISKILSQTIELENKITETTLPPHLKNIILNNLGSIKDAISKYRILGIKSFEKILQSAIGDITINETFYKNHKEKAEIKNMGQIWKKIVSFCDGATKVQKGIESSAKIVKTGTKAIEFIGDIFT